MEQRIYVDALKKSLKSRGVTYAELADSLKMSESGIKKMLNAKDISFQRIIKICNVLDILPGQLFTISENASIPTLELTAKQEGMLIKDRLLLSVYWLFTIEKKSLDEIMRMQKLTSNELKNALQKLVNLELVRHKKNQFLPKNWGKFRWADNSKLAQLLNAEWSRLVLKRSLKLKPDQLGVQRLSALKLSKGSYEKLIEKTMELLDEAAQISEREELTYPQKELHDFTVLVASAEGSLFKGDEDTFF